MTIGSAVSRGGSVYVYDDKNHLLCTHSSGGQLAGFCGTFVCITRGSVAYLYNEKGQQISSVSFSGGSICGCAGNTLSIKRGSSVYMYNEKGQQTGSMPA